ncbi:ribosome maturation factor RimM [Campylobacter suis]|uniref:Ribosome maturation factor RimM n=1 Tax=Campylobacter suis TaxID=2790657 RepID=A0ABM8Q0Z8_9BACT|nr:ribosome maturation factor RimM [Campylobacter suis]CAD7286498.1 Ribosome maturation factor RimM [Campylobacter suis]
MKSDILEVAQLGKSVGLKGYVKLHNRSDFPEQFKKGAKFFDKNNTELVIKHYDKIRSEVLFEDFESIEKAKELTNRILYTTIEQTRKACKLKKDEYFYFDIIGLKVVENNEILGVVDDIEQVAKDSLLLVETDEKLTQNGFAKSFYLPYIDNFVKSIDLQTKEILAINAKALLESS